MEALGSAATVFSVIELGAKICSVCFKYSKAVKNSATEITQLQEAVEVLKNVAEQVQDLLKKPEGQELKKSKSLDQVLKQSYAQLQEIDQKLQSKPTKTWKTFARALKWPFQREEVDGLIRDLQGYNETISHILQVYQTNLLHELCLKAILGTLATANGASFDSHDERHNAVCLPGTRVELLDDIKTWANDSSSKSLFWLNGMAGTGKSTISRTICHDFTKCGQLGASFFFKRGEGDRGNLSRFVTTLATQLSEKYPDFAQSIRKEVDADKAIVRKGPRDQFDKLTKEPLANISLDSPETPFLVFIIDALDECDNDDDIKLIINLFSSCANITNPRIKLKWVITSRPELPIRLCFSAVKGTFQDLILHEIPPSFVERDISTFFKHELDRIKTDYNNFADAENQLPLDWPGKDNIQTLVGMATPLFIFAATTCRFLGDQRCADPGRQLEEILRLNTESQVSRLKATYLPALNSLSQGLSGREQKTAIERFRQIVGPIVLVASPLSTNALAQLLGIPKDLIKTQLNLLYSVLGVPSSDQLPIRLFHLSFRDFLVDPEKQGKTPFWVDEKETHRSLAQNCLRVIKKHLRQDICQLVLPGTRSADIKNDSISDTPLQIYSSVLAFSPKNSLIRRIFEQKITKWILTKPQTNDDWDHCEQVLEGHTNGVVSVAFSPDGQPVASASDDKTVRLWRKDDSACVQELKENTKTLKFDSSGAFLITDHGAMAVFSGASTSHTPSQFLVRPSNDFGISSDRCWILWENIPILWIPIEFRGRFFFDTSTVVLVSETGRVTILKFKNPECIRPAVKPTLLQQYT